jgi:hypothetical protein
MDCCAAETAPQGDVAATKDTEDPKPERPDPKAEALNLPDHRVTSAATTQHQHGVHSRQPKPKSTHP